MPQYIDLHVHSNASDGSLAPGEVVALAKKQQLAAVALTDHDTMAGLPEALKAGRQLSMEVVPGIELSCSYDDQEIHILGLYVDPENQEFQSQVDRLLAFREARNATMVQRFRSNGMELCQEDLAGGGAGTAITRAHFARALVEKGYVASMDQAFQEYLQYGSYYCPKKEGMTPEKAIRLLRQAGAFPVLAHPFQYQLGKQGLEGLAAWLKSLGLMGIEVYYSAYSQYKSGQLKALAARQGLLPTGGSDFHGENKPRIHLGTGMGGLKVSYLLLEDIKRQLGQASLA